MGRLGGFRYREIVKRLKALGFEFHRQAAGSHEIWFNAATQRYTTIPNHARRHLARDSQTGRNRRRRFPAELSRDGLARFQAAMTLRGLGSVSAMGAHRAAQ